MGNKIKIYYKETMRKCGLTSSDSEQGSVTGSYEYVYTMINSFLADFGKFILIKIK
jgi:hypothetical protein